MKDKRRPYIRSRYGGIVPLNGGIDVKVLREILRERSRLLPPIFHEDLYPAAGTITRFVLRARPELRLVKTANEIEKGET